MFTLFQFLTFQLYIYTTTFTVISFVNDQLVKYELLI